MEKESGDWMIYSYIYDFISLLFEYEDIREKVRKIILFGSVASGEYDEKSDVDIFIDTLEDRIEDEVEEAKKRFREKIKRKWSLKGIENPISYIVGDLENERWSDLKEDIISNGVTLYGKYEELPEKLEYFSLFTYSLSELSQPEKMKIIRKLFGYKTEKQGEVYKKKGIIGKIGGKKLASNVLLVPVKESKKIKEVFSNFGITPKIREVWMK